MPGLTLTCRSVLANPVIRPATLDDASAIAAIYAPVVEQTAASFEDVAPTATEMAERMAKLLGQYPYLVAEQDGEVFGYAYGGAHRSRAAYAYSADVTIYIAPHAKRRGVGQALYNPLLKALKDQGMHRAYAAIALPNDGSVGLHESFGFKHIGTYSEVGFKFGKWHDVGWWERDLTK